MSVKNIVYLTDVSQITCVVQEGRGDVILKAARQLGISLGRLVDKKWGARFEKAFPWICLLIGAFYILLFVLKLVPNAEG